MIYDFREYNYIQNFRYGVMRLIKAEKQYELIKNMTMHRGDPADAIREGKWNELPFLIDGQYMYLLTEESGSVCLYTGSVIEFNGKKFPRVKVPSLIRTWSSMYAFLKWKKKYENNSH